MLLFIVLFTICVFVIFMMSNDVFISFFLGLFIGVMLFAIIGGVISKNIISTEEYVVSDTELYAIKDSNGIEGQKFLFSGYINDKLTIRYVLNTENGKR